MLKNRSTIKINPEWMQERDRKVFHEHFMRWAEANTVPFTAEAKFKLNMI